MSKGLVAKFNVGDVCLWEFIKVEITKVCSPYYHIKIIDQRYLHLPKTHKVGFGALKDAS